jgi:hypothetical protein
MKTEKQPSPARNYLQAVSRELRAAAAMQGLTINDLLTEIYSQQAACGDWGTFAQWKKQGYRVQKGESGFAVWSRPMKNNDTDADDTTPGDTTPADTSEPADADADGKKEREFFRVAYIFNARQVASREGLTPSGDEYQPTGLTPPHLQQVPAEAPAPAPQPAEAPATPTAAEQPQPAEAPATPAAAEQPQPAPAPATAPQYIEQLALAI